MAANPLPHTRRNPLRRLPITLALLLALVVASCAFPEEAFDGTLEGNYYLNGTDRDGVEFSGTLVITPTDDPDTYDMQWIVTGSIQTGTGVVADDEITISWDAMEGFDEASRGEGRYSISPEGELAGERTVAGQEGTVTEEAFPIK